jgi:hypothetical protein
MKDSIRRRLDEIDRQRAKNQKASERKAFLLAAKIILPGYHLGGLKSGGKPIEAFARALKYRSLGDFLKAFAHALQIGSAAELGERCNDAFRELLGKFGYDGSTPEKFEEALTTMGEQLPPEWKAWIAEMVGEADYDEERQLKEKGDQLLAVLENWAIEETAT